MDIDRTGELNKIEDKESNNIQKIFGPNQVEGQYKLRSLEKIYSYIEKIIDNVRKEEQCCTST